MRRAFIPAVATAVLLLAAGNQGEDCAQSENSFFHLSTMYS